MYTYIVIHIYKYYIWTNNCTYIKEYIYNVCTCTHTCMYKLKLHIYAIVEKDVFQEFKGESEGYMEVFGIRNGRGQL